LITDYRQYFEGHGWFAGEVTAYDGDSYTVVYKDGNREEYDDREMEHIVLTTEEPPSVGAADVGFGFGDVGKDRGGIEPEEEQEEGDLPPKKKRARREDSLMLMAIEPPEHVDPEITIEPAAVFDGDFHWTIHLAHEEDETSVAYKREWILRGYRLIRTRLLAQNFPSLNAFDVHSASGALTLLRHCESCCSPESSRAFSAVAKAIEDGTLKLDCVANGSSVEVMISLTEQAFQECSAGRLPLHKRTFSKKYQSATHLHHALAELFSETIVADVVKTHEQAEPISAKTVYNLIDNVQLRDYEESGGYDCKPMSIPGLVPTLRPYQEAAVKWMLQREQCPRETNEWELAWVVLTDPQNRAKANHRYQEKSMLLNEREIISLFEWKRQTESKEVESGVLYCPFVGLLAKSCVEAYTSTLNSFLGSGDGCEWANSTGGILADAMGLGKTVEVRAGMRYFVSMFFCRVTHRGPVIICFQVLACVLANRHPNFKSTTPATASMEFEEEKKERCDDDVVVVDRTPAQHAPLKSRVNHFGACICGTASSFRGCLSIILCRSCHEPLHGVCAGFTSLEQLEAETYNQTVENCVVPTCSSDRCPTCVFTQAQKTKGLIESRATLIITPAAILTQWEREIRRHVAFDTEAQVSTGETPSRMISVKGLKVLVYPGLRELCNQSSNSSRTALVGSNTGFPRIHLIHPHILADADIVLMTFDALMGDLGHSDDNPYVASGRRLRTHKRYRVLPSPLTGIKWFRVCLDEAQKVETPTATSAKMALKLAAHHRWCVSGTPIGRGKLDDLYGLFSFLKLGPFSSKKWFQICMNPSNQDVEDRITQLLSSVIWRSTKASESVRNQIGIPEQTENRVVLKFSSIEKHFYERQLEATLEVATEVMDKKRSGKARKTADDLLASHLHRLRAACCHPQVGSCGIRRSRRKRKTHHVDGVDDGHHDISVGSRVLTMDQILARLIDDARLKCEEAQRLAVLHTNALASLQKIKVEAKGLGVNSNESDEFHLTQSCRSYMECLDLIDSNAKPTMVVGDAILSGGKGFLASNMVIPDGKAKLEWHIRAEDDAPGGFREVWSRFDFEGPKKNIVEIIVRPITQLSKVPREALGSACSSTLAPSECTFQVSSSAVGGEFVDVVSFTLPDDSSEELSFGAFLANHSKSWRVLVKNYHQHEVPPSDELQVFYVGLELQLMEADISTDILPRLHVLHNASISMSSLIHHHDNKNENDETRVHVPFMTVPSMKEKVKWMQSESRKIESLYMKLARNVHAESQRQLRIATHEREEVQGKLFSVSPTLPDRQKSPPFDWWADEWWNDVLSMAFLYGSVQEGSSLCERVRQDLEDFMERTQEGTTYEHRSFPDFNDVDGIKAGLDLRLHEKSSRLSHPACMQSVSALSSHPSQADFLDNAHCKECRKDWNQTGPQCRHCNLEKRMNELERDPVIIVILKSLHKWLVETITTGKLGSQRKTARVDKRAEYFFDVLKSSEREMKIARCAWRTHFDLLSDLDELNQCKRTMRLAAEGEDLTALTAEELGSIVTPWDIPVRAMDHAAKQAMALATLRRNKDTLRYLKCQNKERLEERERAARAPGDSATMEGNICIVCLSPFDDERAVLACGHSFHYSPCLERLMAKAGNHHVIPCPLRCTARTTRNEVMIASERRRDDGSQSVRKVKGSWGTKVTRLLSDVMDVSDRAEKSIVFSQWEDMLDVVEEALKANGVQYVRAKTLRKIGDVIKTFRSTHCAVLLLNLKNGAEGLTLVEATHVFMIEPLLNCGLDSQGTSRQCALSFFAAALFQLIYLLFRCFPLLSSHQPYPSDRTEIKDVRSSLFDSRHY
jgi:E3 ubiquitin-protein ligase SHPRH